MRGFLYKFGPLFPSLDSNNFKNSKWMRLEPLAESGNSLLLSLMSCSHSSQNLEKPDIPWFASNQGAYKLRSPAHSSNDKNLEEFIWAYLEA